MKKITAILLLVLLTASFCFVLTGCQSQCEKRGWHDFYPADTCRICKKTKCEAGIHDWDDIFCSVCRTTKCKEGKHAFAGSENCSYCGVNCCDIGEHHYINYRSQKICSWCERPVCDIEGHDWYDHTCKVCKKVSFFGKINTFFYNLFPEDNSYIPDEELPQEEDESAKFWDMVGTGALLLAAFLFFTALASLIYWIGALFNSSVIAYIAHGFMLLLTFGLFLVLHWAWGLVFFLVFDGIYFGLISRLLNERYGFHDTSWF